MEVVSYLLGKKSGGGGGVEEYISTELKNNTSNNGQVVDYLVKAFPSNTITVDSNVTSLTSAFQGYKGDKIPNLVINGTIATTDNMFAQCSNITNVPLFNTSNVTNMMGMFGSCSNLETVPLFDTSNVTNAQNMFSQCSKLTEIPQFNFAKVTNAASLFYGCDSLKSIPNLNTQNVVYLQSLIYSVASSGNYCDLESIGEIDCTKVQNISYIFSSWHNNRTHESAYKYLTTLGGFKDLGKGYLTTVSQNYGNYTLDLSICFNLTHDSLMNVINKLYDIGSAGVQPQKLVLGEYNLAKLSANEIAIATNKGWVVS